MSAEDVIVVKVGTGVLTRVEDGSLDGESLVRLATALAGLAKNGERLVLVSSGAVGAGVSALDLKSYPEDLATKQAAAAIGQVRLMHTYDALLWHFELGVAQLLLTSNELQTEETRKRVSDVLERLLLAGNILPVINENDSVAVEELSVGDNDLLSVMVAELLQAKLLIVLTSVDGLLDEEGELIAEVQDVEGVFKHVEKVKGRFSIGGMSTKLKAVKRAVDFGIPTVIANGRHPERLEGIVAGREVCTRFVV